MFALLLFDAEAGRGGGVAAAFVFFSGVVGGVFEVGGGRGNGGGGGLAFGAGVGDGVEGWGGGGVVGVGEVLLWKILLGWVDGLEREGGRVCFGVEVKDIVYLRKGVVAC